PPVRDPPGKPQPEGRSPEQPARGVQQVFQSDPDARRPETEEAAARQLRVILPRLPGRGEDPGRTEAGRVVEEKRRQRNPGGRGEGNEPPPSAGARRSKREQQSERGGRVFRDGRPSGEEAGEGVEGPGS